MKNVNWGVLGTAHIAQGHTIPGMQQAQNCTLYAIAGRSLEKARDFQQKFGFSKAYGSYEELLSDPQVEAVYIPLPNELHYEWTVKALNAGKHVLCEKPLAPNARQAEELYALAREKGLYLMEAFAYLHSPLTAAIKAEVDAGTIGELLYMESEFITSDYDLSNIRMRRETFGGATYDLGCYNLSQILWMFGQEPETVRAVTDYAPSGIDALTTGILTFPGHKRAAFTCGMTLATEQNHRIDRLHINGTLGHIHSDARFNQDGDLSYTVTVNGNTVTKTVPTRQNYALEVEQLGRCILSGEAPFVTSAFSLSLARTMDRVLEAIGYGLE